MIYSKIDMSIFNQVTKLEFPKIEQPRRAHVFLGKKCSYRCRFCYGTGEQNQDFYPIEQVKEYIKFLHSYGITEIEYTGGEPTECSYLVELVKYVSDTYGMKQCIITNGSASVEYYRTLYESGVSEFLFSLHGYDSESHQQITCIPDSWNKIIHSMDYVHSIDALLRINVTICKYNYQNLVEQAKFISERYPNVFQINYLPMNSWDNSIKNEDISVSYKEYFDELYDAIQVLESIKHKPRIAIRYVPFCVIDKELWKYVYDYAQHVYDPYDWNVELDGHTVKEHLLENKYGVTTVQEILKKRRVLYTKFGFCTYCKNRNICDGFQTNQLERESGNLESYKNNAIFDHDAYKNILAYQM